MYLYTSCAIAFLCCLVYWYPVLQWFFSGVISSIGLGTGANTGVLFLMPYTATIAKSHDSFWVPYRQALPATVLHAMGSACGELPPFFLADRLIQKLPGKKQIEWMAQYMRLYGWWMIFVCGCWPSMFFDICGLSAGILRMDTTTFLSATMAGKVVKSCILSGTLIVAVQEGKDIFPEEVPPFMQYFRWIGYALTLYTVGATCREYYRNHSIFHIVQHQ